MNLVFNKIVSIFKPWFLVDSRALGLYRIFLGLLCLSDIIRRWEFIDIFYTEASIIKATLTTSSYRNFTLLNTFTASWEVHLFFIVGIIFSILLIVGYKTKLSQIMTAIIIISIHNRTTMLENAGDFFMNCMLIWMIFLPLGISFSLDSLRKSLDEYKENSVGDLNDRKNGMNKPSNIYSLAFFCILYQLSSIYFFTALNKSGYDWSNGTAVYKMFQLDTFLTPVGFYFRDYITMPVTKFLTYSTLTIEYLAPLLLFIPFYTYIIRSVFILVFTIFHISIRLFIKVGLFSHIMISTFILLIPKNIFDYVRNTFINKYNNSPYILFYDSDCGFCHYTVRVIKRLDIFNRLTFADSSYKGVTPDHFDTLSKKSAILYDKNNQKYWLKHQAFGKVLFLLPFGFIFGWIFFIPLLSNIFEYIYNLVAKNRTSISTFLGQPACGIKSDIRHEVNLKKKSPIILFYAKKIGVCFMLLLILRSSINYGLSANEGVNDLMEDYGFGKKYFTYNQNMKKIAYYPRMIQRWNMFSPTVLASDKTIVVEATLSNGDIINPYTGEAPELSSLDYPDLWHSDNQFWRKFFSRISKNNKKKELKRFESWLKRYNNHYFKDNTDNLRIKSVNIWSLSQRNSNINSKTKNKIAKRLLNPSSNKSQNNNTKEPKPLN